MIPDLLKKQDWKMLALSSLLALLFPVIYLLLLAFVVGSFYQPLYTVGASSPFLALFISIITTLLSLLAVFLVPAVLLYLLIRKLVGFEFGKEPIPLFISLTKIWLVAFALFLVFDLLVLEPTISQAQVQWDKDCLPPPGLHVDCGSRPQSFEFLPIFFMLPSNPIFFFLGAYLARRFLEPKVVEAKHVDVKAGKKTDKRSEKRTQKKAAI